jgi:hypothetical protein
MPVLSRPAVLAATTSMAAVSMTAALLVSPGAAFAADTTTTLTGAQMAAALHTVATTSTTAAAPGWKATMSLTGEALSGSGTYVVDPVGGVAYQQFKVAGHNVLEYAVNGKGTYRNLQGPTEPAAVKMMKRPAVRFVFQPQASLRLADYVKENAPVPAEVLTDDVTHPGTTTVHDDGSAEFAFHDADGIAITFAVGTTGALTGAKAVDEGLNTTLAYTYGAQHVTVPAAAVTVSSATLAQGVAYLGMPAAVKNVANRGAGDTRKAARGRTVKVATLRKTVRRDAASFNAGAHLSMVKVKDVRGGVRVSATNPWTHTTVAYTVKAAGKKVTVKK